MASRFWVGGTGTWDASDTTHWAATSGGAGGQSVPVAGDAVTIDASSGAGTITVATDFNITSLTCGQMGMTLDFSANNNSPTISSALTTSGTGTRTINWGSGTFTMSGNNITIFGNGTTTGQTMTGSAAFNFTYSGSVGTRSFQFGGTGAGTISTTTCTFNITAGTDTVSFSGTNIGISSLSFTGFSGTWSSSSTSITFGKNLTMSATMTNSVTAILQWTVASSSGTITSNGKSFASAFIVNATSGTVTLADALVTTSSFTLTLGTFNANGFNVTCSSFSSSNSNTRTLTMSTGQWTITGNAATVWDITTFTGLTFNKGTLPVIFNYSGSTGTRTIVNGAITPLQLSSAIDVSITAGTDTIAISNSRVGHLVFTGFSGTFSNGTRIIYGNLTLTSGMTVGSGVSVTTLAGTSGTQTITSNGNNMDFPLTIDGIGGTVSLADTMTIGATRTVTLTNGTLDTNGQACSWGLFSSSNSNTRVLTLGASTISLTGTGTISPWNCQTSTNMTLNAGTSTLVFATGGQSPTFQGGGLTYYNLSITNTSGGFVLGQSNTFNNVTFAQGSGNRSFSLGTSTTQTINGLLTLTGFTVNQSRLRIQSNTFGTQCTFALGATGTVAITNTDFSDIAFTGTNAPVSGTSLGDVGGNSGITFDAARTVYWVNGTGNMSSTSNWSLTSGGASGTDVPLCQDTLIFDANSFSAPGQTVTQDIFRCGSVNFSAVTNSPTWSFADSSSAGLLIVGSLTLSPSMSVTCASATGADVLITLTSRTSQTWTNAGITWGTGFIFTVNAPGGTYTLQDNFVMSDATRTFTCTRGTFNANGYNVTCGLFNSSNSETRTLTMGSGTWTLTGTGTVWNVGTTTNLTFSGASSTIIFTDASAASKTFSTGTGAAAYGNFIALPGGAGAIVFNSNDKSFNSLNIFGPKTVTFNAGTTYTVLSPNFSGSPGSVVTVQSSSAGSPFILSTPSGYVRATYASIKDSTAQGGAYFEAVNSTSVSGNTGWNFATASAGGGLQAGKKFAAFGGARPINKVLDSKLHGYRKLGG